MNGRGQGLCKCWSRTKIPPLVRAHPAWPLTQAMSASSKMAKGADEAISDSSWTALAKGKELGWWSIDLEGEMEKLEVMGPWSGMKADPWIPKGRWATGQLG